MIPCHGALRSRVSIARRFAIHRYCTREESPLPMSQEVIASSSVLHSALAPLPRFWHDARNSKHHSGNGNSHGGKNGWLLWKVWFTAGRRSGVLRWLWHSRLRSARSTVRACIRSAFRPSTCGAFLRSRVPSSSSRSRSCQVQQHSSKSSVSLRHNHLRSRRCGSSRHLVRRPSH